MQQLRYHGYFLGSSSFTLIYEFLHDPNAATSHLPWVYASLQHLSTMRAGDPITSTIKAIRTVLRNINPAYEWSPCPGGAENYSALSKQDVSLLHASGNTQIQQPSPCAFDLSPNALPNPRLDIQTAFWNLPQFEGPETGRSGGSNEDLLDFTQSDMGWDFDFSTMDMEAFFSVYQSADASVS